MYGNHSVFQTASMVFQICMIRKGYLFIVLPVHQQVTTMYTYMGSVAIIYFPQAGSNIGRKQLGTNRKLYKNCGWNLHNVSLYPLHL